MPLSQEPPPLVELSQVVTPLNAGAWDKQLQNSLTTTVLSFCQRT